MIAKRLPLYAQPRVVAILFLGFSSGLPLALTASTLGTWMAQVGVSKAAIGLFASVATPYALKFLWAPLIDGTRFPVLCRLFGQRRGWLLATQLATMLALVLLGMADPAANAWMTALAALCVAICSASQDIVIDAYRVEILPPEQAGAGAANAVLGYRIGMITSTAGALWLSVYVGWMLTYWAMAALLCVGMAAALLAGEPESRREAQLPATMTEWAKRYIFDPFREFTTRQHWFAILMFIILYKLADAFMGVMTNPFLLEIGFSVEQIALVLKVYGVVATIAGSFIGGWLVSRWGIVRSLWVCGIAHALTNLMFVVQARVGADINILALGITMENVSGGMGLAAFVAYISQLCNQRFTATQYALLSSLAAVGRTWLSTPAGWVAEKLGWELFFFVASSLAAPGLIVLWWLQKHQSASSDEQGK